MAEEKDQSSRSSEEDAEFERIARGRSSGLLSEMWGFLRENKKWWLLPLIAVLILVGALIVLSSTAVAPFIYTLF